LAYKGKYRLPAMTVYRKPNEVLTLIDSGTTSEGWLWLDGSVGINHIDYEMCNDMYDGGIDDSVVLCADVPSGSA
jgi:hypothetical protein